MDIYFKNDQIPGHEISLKKLLVPDMGQTTFSDRNAINASKL